MQKISYYLQYLLVPLYFILVLAKEIARAVVYSIEDTMQVIEEHKRTKP